MLALCIAAAEVCLPLTLSCQAIAAPPRKEIAARVWFNNPPFLLHDKRDVVLFFFDTRGPASRRLVPQLNRLARRHNTVVIGLTTDSRSQAKAFIKRYKVRFTVGAESRCAKVFGVNRVPALLFASGTDRDNLRPLSTDKLAELLPSWGTYGEEDVAALQETWEIEAFVASNAFGRNRAKAVWKLYEKLGPDEFAEFARDRLRVERDPWVRNTLAFLSGRPTPDEIARQREPAPSATYQHMFEPDRDAPVWTAARRYLALREPLDQQPTRQLIEDYWKHFSDEPSDVLIRRWIARSIEHPHDKPAARQAVLEMLAKEPDWAIRVYLTGALSNICTVPDTHAADALEQLAAAEPNVLHVKPLMEYVAFYLRTGEEDARKMPPRPPENN